MNLLALDTSTEFLSLALQCGQQVHTYHENVGPKASEQILPKIQALLDAAGKQLSDLDGIAFGAGPGAFTGVRVACGVAQGLAFGANLPVVGVNTLQVVAEASGKDKVMVCQDARMGEVYYAAFERAAGVWQCVLESGVCKPQDVPELSGTGWTGAGKGWAVYEKELRDIYAEQVVEIMGDVTPNASALLTLATAKFAQGNVQSAPEIRPIYIRNRVALTSNERAQGLKM